MPLSPQEIVSLARYFDKDGPLVKEARAALLAGKYDIKCAVQVAGELTVFEDYFQRKVGELLTMRTISLLVTHLVNKEILSKQAALGLLEKVLEESLTKPQSEEEMEKSKDPFVLELLRTKKQVTTRIRKATPESISKGSTKFNGLAEVHSPAKTFAVAPV